MNKKFSTLVGCLAFGTAFSAVAQVTTNFPIVGADAYNQVIPCATGLTYRSFGTNSNAALGSEVNKIEADKWYQLRATNEEGVEGILIQERDFVTGEVTLRIVDPAVAPLNYSLWKIAYNKADGATGGKFTFVNKETGLGIVYDHETAYTKEDVGVNSPVISNTAASILSGCNEEWSWFSTNKVSSGTLSDKVLYAQFHDSEKYIVLKPVVGNQGTVANVNGLNISGPQVAAVVYTSADAGDAATACHALKVTPVVAESIVLRAKDINRMIDAQKDGAAGFNFMTPTGIGNRTAMSPEDNSTLDTYKYIAVEDESIVEGLLEKANNALTAEEKAQIEIAFKVVDNHYKIWSVADATGANWNKDDGRETFKAVGTAYSLYQKAVSLEDKIRAAKDLAVAIAADYRAYYPEQAAKNISGWVEADGTGNVTDSRINASVNLVALVSPLAALDGLKSTAYWKQQAAMARQFPIRLQAQINADPTKNDKYLMVDTARWEEATENPSNSPELYLANKKPDMKNGLFVDARFNFRLTYFPTQDSLVIEPLNASVMTDAEYKADTYWRNSIVASQFISSSDITAGRKGLSASNTELATASEEAPVAVMLSKLNTKDGWVVTAGGTDKPKGASATGTLHTCIEFDHSYPVLARGTVEEGVYLLNLVTEKQPNTYSHRVNGTNIVADMNGHVIYDQQEKSQDFTHMPAAQWVVEYTGCKEDGKARVKIVNREYAKTAFEGQLYAAGDNKFYIINHKYDNYLGNHSYSSTELACSDTLLFTKIEANTLGYLNPGDKVIENTFKLKQFFNYGEDPYYLNAVKVGSDTILRVQDEGSNFELVPAFDAYTVKMGDQTFVISPENMPFGYTSEDANAPQLYKSIYRLKVKDADKINNDRIFVGVNKDGKYCVADTLDSKYPEYRVAYFTLKENNHWPKEGDGNHYYSLVETSWNYNFEANEDGETYRLVYNFYDDVKLAIEQGQLDAKQEDLCQDRTEAFALEADTMPYYRRLAGLENTEFYSVNNNNRVLFENNGFMGIHSVAEETLDNKLFVDTAWVSETSMPTYLLARDVNKLITDTCQHGDHPGASEHWRKVEYLQGRYMIDLGSIKNEAIPSYVDKTPYAQMYSRYAFVNAIHMSDTLYIMKTAKDSIKYQHELTEGKAKVLFALPMEKETLNGAPVAFRLKDHENDVTKGQFYIETTGVKYGFAINGNAWMKEQNNSNIVSTASGETVNHNGESSWNPTYYEDIYQALLLDTEAKGGATSNEEIETPSSVTVIAGNGQVTVAGAAGKKVVITNILGQTVANTVVTSDNATIAAPAGVVVVAIEGEGAVKAIVK